MGLFTFGGGYAMIANIRETVIEKKHWLTEDELLQVITIAESTPGPIAINLATYVGYKKRGVLGSLFATAGVVLPSFLIIYGISLFLDAFMENRYVADAFTGIKCAVAFLILKAGWNMLAEMEKKVLPILCFSAVFLLMILLELFALDFSTIVLILAGGIVGIVTYAIFGKSEESK